MRVSQSGASRARNRASLVLAAHGVTALPPRADSTGLTMSQISTVTAPASLHANDIETSLFGEPPADPSLKFAAAMIMAMLDSGEGISDLVFSPGRPPQVERHGH